MKVEFNKSGFIQALFINGQNIIYPWSIETGGPASFFSLVNKGWRVRALELSKYIDDRAINRKLEVNSTDGKWLLYYEDYLNDKETIHRNAEVECIENSWFMDFVIGYRFTKASVRYALIDNQKILHKNSNKYYQYSVNHLELVTDLSRIQITLDECSTSKKFHPVMYVRDFRDEWIIHCRLLPKIPDKEIIKLNNKFYNKAIPDPIAKWLLKSVYFKKMIWYRSEINPYPRWNLLFKYILKPNGYYLVRLDRGSKIAIKSSMYIIPTA